MLGISEQFKEVFYRKAFKKGIRSNFYILPPISDELLAMLYSNASAVLYPTLHEGFGFPVLEALLSQVPVLASNVASLPEISGGFAFLLSPNDIKIWEKTLRWILNNPNDISLRKCLENGYKWASNFSWDKTVMKTFNLFREIALK